ncbi:MAG: response regulator [Candidatus Limnocylindria bacterium]
MPRTHIVLVVDDDRDVRAYYADALEQAGHLVWQATNGADAFGRLQGGEVPCVVLADVRMPKMDGWDLSRAAGRDPQLASVPIVLVTADRLLSYTSPVLDKPMSPDELDALVERSCRLHRSSELGADEA